MSTQLHEPEPATKVPASEDVPAQEHATHGIVVRRPEQAIEITVAQAFAAWWRRAIPSWMSQLGAQVVVAIIIVLIALPVAARAGWVSVKFAAPGSSASTTSSAGNAGNTSMVNMPGMTTAAAPATPHQTYNAQPPAAPTGDSVDVKLVARQATVMIAPGIAYQAWTFNGTVPGPIIRVRQGQTVNFTLTNDSSMPHSIDFHAAQTPPNVNYVSVAPGKSFSFSFKANYPGVFLYHCGTPPVMVHLANGMYGAIIVDPSNGYTPAQEYVLVQSEFYTTKAPDGTYTLDGAAMMNGQPTYTVFNGYAGQYKDQPLTAKTGQKIRLFVVDAGPSHFSAFHVIGAIFSDYYPDGNPSNHLVGDQTITVPPGGGAVVELTIPQAGSYTIVTHSFSDMDKGAAGVLKVTP